MSGRDLNPNRIHLARHYLGDDKVTASRNALDAIARGKLKRDRTDTTAPEGETWAVNEPAAVHAALERSRIVPTALDHACPRCDAAPGCYCTTGALSVCGSRATLACRALATA
jgi:hypothetical protein